ncbi:hypothetical protein LINPERPRIM_LOCUS40826 [Linum perenne]
MSSNSISIHLFLRDLFIQLLRHLPQTFFYESFMIEHIFFLLVFRKIFELF